jgi:hypothetical protein
MITLQNETDLAHLPKPELPPWYAIRTKSNCENMAALSLANKGYKQYLPLYRKHRPQSQPVIETDFPLFSGYLFRRLHLNIPLRIVTTLGHRALPILVRRSAHSPGMRPTQWYRRYLTQEEKRSKSGYLGHHAATLHFGHDRPQIYLRRLTNLDSARK